MEIVATKLSQSESDTELNLRDRLTNKAAQQALQWVLPILLSVVRKEQPRLYNKNCQRFQYCMVTVDFDPLLEVTVHIRLVHNYCGFFSGLLFFKKLVFLTFLFPIRIIRH